MEQVTPDHYRCAVQGESDQNGRNRQASWYYFRVDGAPRRELTLDLTDLAGEYNFHPGTHPVNKNTRPVYSYDGKHWTTFKTVEWDERLLILRLRLTPKHSTFWIAHVPPYTNGMLADLLAHFRGNPDLRQAVAGKSVGGRDILLLTVTASDAPDTGKKTVWLLARQHAWEASTTWVLEGALRFLLSADPAAARLRRGFVFRLIPIADPDGVARGGVRFNANGYDVNRNWDAVDPKLMPEIAALRRSLLEWVDGGRRIDLFLALHDQEGLDLLEGPLSAGGPALRTLAERLCERLNRETAFSSAGTGPVDSGATTAPGARGRMTVDQGLVHERRIPALLLELTVESVPKLARVPTTDDRLRFGADLVKVIEGALGPE